MIGARRAVVNEPWTRCKYLPYPLILQRIRNVMAASGDVTTISVLSALISAMVITIVTMVATSWTVVSIVRNWRWRSKKRALCLNYDDLKSMFLVNWHAHRGRVSRSSGDQSGILCAKRLSSRAFALMFCGLLIWIGPCACACTRLVRVFVCL